MRMASHAGSWYSDNPQKLQQELSQYFNNVKENQLIPKSIIGPHAGFAYSGQTAAFAYKPLQNLKIDDFTIFLLGPCHKTHLPKCGLTLLKKYNTPLGDININQKINKELQESGLFINTNQQIEEDEHSLEMHLPFIVYSLQGKNYDLVPVMVPHLKEEQIEQYAQVFGKYYKNKNVIFIYSSDFCHWGKNIFI